MTRWGGALMGGALLAACVGATAEETGKPMPTSTDAAASTAVWWPKQPQFPPYVDGSKPQDIAQVRAVVFPTQVVVGVGQKFYLGAHPCMAYNGRGESVTAVAIPHPATKTYFTVFTNPAQLGDHTGYVAVKLQHSPPTAQVYLEGLKAGKVVVRCHPAVRITDGSQKVEVHLRHVFADIEVEVK